jgi:beta-glucanase (GH16 family)
LKWADELDVDGAPNPEYWTHETGGWGWGNEEVQTYTDSLDNSRVENGRLIIEVHQDTSGAIPRYTSARLMTKEKAQWKYGRIEAKARIPSETGTWSAIWMLSADTIHSNTLWPDNGEIDIMEHVGYKEDPIYQAIQGVEDNIHGTLHTYNRNGRDNQGVGGSSLVPEASTEFKVYAINWTEEQIEFEVDGQITHTITAEDLLPSRVTPKITWPFWPFTQRFHLILNVAIGGTWGGLFNTEGIYKDTSPYGTDGINHEGTWPQRMELEYVRVYQGPENPAITTIPGIINPLDLHDSKGILIEKTLFQETGHNLHSIDADDWASFVLQTARSGTFKVTATIASSNSNVTIGLTTETNGEAGPMKTVPGTGSAYNYQVVELGQIHLDKGLSTLRMDTTTGGFKVADIQLELAGDIPWQGVLVDGYGDLDTNTLLGVVNVNQSPWLYVFDLDKFIYSPAAAGGNFQTESQWIYLPKN